MSHIDAQSVADGLHRTLGGTLDVASGISGIGESCAHKFAQAGYNLIVTARRSDLLACLKRKLERQGVEVLPLVFDVRDRQAAHDAIAGLPQEWAEVDVLVNNA